MRRRCGLLLTRLELLLACDCVRAPQVAGGAGALLAGRGLYRHILIALNQSAAANKAPQRAIQPAAKLNATLTAVSATPSLSIYAVYAAAFGPEAHQTMESDERTLLLGIHPDHEMPGRLSGCTAHRLAEEVTCGVLGVH